MESERRLKAKISVLEYLTKNKTLYDRDGIELAGDYWYDIKADVNERCKGNFFRETNSGGVKQEGGINVLFTEQVYAFLAECKDKLDELENDLYDRELTREAKKMNIRYTRRAYVISLVSLAISILSAIGALKQFLLWLYNAIF